MNNNFARIITGVLLLSLYLFSLHLGFVYYAGIFICAALYAIIFECPLLLSRWPFLLRWLIPVFYFFVTFLGWVFVYNAYAHESFFWVAYPVFAVVVCDSSAYFVGRFWGRYRVFPVISPKKTYEGILAGCAGVICFNYVSQYFFSSPQGVFSLVVQYPVLSGLVLATCAILGDLSISVLKRSVGVKDSGRLLPGHGGVLDRVGSVVFVFMLILIIVFLDK